MHRLRSSVAVATVMTLLSILPVSLGSVEPWAGYAMLPGVLFGMYFSTFMSGNPHGVQIAPTVIVGGIVNLGFYTIVCLAVLAICSKIQRRQK